MPYSYAQVLDDSVADSDEDEELFNDMFSDYSETDKDVTKVKKFDDVIDQAGEILKKIDTKSEEPDDNANKGLPPISGDLFVGITKGSFQTYSTLRGTAACSFSVTLKSTLNRDIKSMGFYLVYPKRTFAFMYLDMKANTVQTHTIRTSGDICYNLVGIPDINIHKCRIYGASSKECSTRLKWSDNISSDGEVSE